MLETSLRLYIKPYQITQSAKLLIELFWIAYLILKRNDEVLKCSDQFFDFVIFCIFRSYDLIDCHNDFRSKYVFLFAFKFVVILVLFNRFVEVVNKYVFYPQLLVVNRKPKIFNFRLKLGFVLLLVLVKEHSLQLIPQDSKHIVTSMIVPYDFRLLDTARRE